MSTGRASDADGFAQCKSLLRRRDVYHWSLGKAFVGKDKLVRMAMAAQLGVRAPRLCSGLTRSVGASQFRRVAAARQIRALKTHASSENGSSKAATLEGSTGELIGWPDTFFVQSRTSHDATNRLERLLRIICEPIGFNAVCMKHIRESCRGQCRLTVQIV